MNAFGCSSFEDQALQEMCPTPDAVGFRPTPVPLLATLRTDPTRGSIASLQSAARQTHRIAAGQPSTGPAARSEERNRRHLEQRRSQAGQMGAAAELRNR